jgi:hypothetical protein
VVVVEKERSKDIKPTTFVACGIERDTLSISGASSLTPAVD